MKKVICPLLLAVATASLHAGAGLFDSFIIVRTASDTYYDVGAVSLNPDFQGSSLGSFDASTDNLQLGGQTKTYKNDGSDVTSASLQYRIWQVSESGSFTGFGYTFQIDSVGGTGGDQQWGSDVAGGNSIAYYTSNLLSGLSAGDYTLEVFTQITTNGINADSIIYANNGTANYEATFTIVPEPGTFALVAGLLGFIYVAIRRRVA